MFFNSGNTEIFYDVRNDPVEIPARCYFDLPFASSESIRYVKTLELSSDVRRVTFIRRFALGDVLMLIPVAREFKARYPGVQLRLVTNLDKIRGVEFVEIFNEGVFDGVFNDTKIFPTSYDIAFYLDNVLERDHTVARYSEMSRVDIFREFFNLPTNVETHWTDKIWPAGQSGIVFCSSGIKKLKTLDKETADLVLAGLKEISADVTHIGEGVKISPKDLVEKLCRALVLVTVDSAPLWMAHFTRTPTVLISGPTRGKERLYDHPLKPEGVSEVSLSKIVNCEPCFERMERCNGKASCMSANKNLVWKQVKSAVESVRWKTR